MRVRLFAALASSALIGSMSLIAAGPAASHYQLSGSKFCGGISFSPGTDLGSSHYGAGGIRARRTSCATAKAIARKSKDGSNRTFSSRGFRCKPKRHAGHVDYKCTKGTATVVFAKIG